MRHLFQSLVLSVFVLSGACGDGAGSTPAPEPTLVQDMADVPDGGGFGDIGWDLELDLADGPELGPDPDLDPDPEPEVFEFDYDENLIPEGVGLFLPDGTRFDIKDTLEALDAVIQSAPDTPVVFFVHGRACGGGGEPQKSLGEAIPAIADGYGVLPILFVWPGAGDSCPLGFPERQARESGYALAVLAGFVTSHRLRSGPEQRYILLTHSMGSFLLEEAVAAPFAQRLPVNAFDSIIINASASAARDHAAWLEQLHFASRVLVAVNGDDNVLRAAGVGRTARLGYDISASTLSPKGVYSNFTGRGVNHAYYVPASPDMRALYDSLILDTPFNPSNFPNISVQERDGAVIWDF